MKRVIALFLTLVMCLSVVTLTGCKKNEDTNTDNVTTDDVFTETEALPEVYLTLYAFGDQEQEYKFNVTTLATTQEYGMICMPATAGDKIGDILSENEYADITPVENKGKFEGWMEYKEVADMVDGFEQYSYEKLSGDKLYSTQQLLKRKMPQYSVMYVAKWDNLDDEYYAMMGY